MIYEADYAVKMNDGITIRYDVYRPKKEGSFPVIVTYGPYSKGMHFSQSYGLFWKRIKEAYPEILEGTSGKYMNWETVDPEKWVLYDYAVVKIDSRGTGRSEGVIDSCSDREGNDLRSDLSEKAGRPHQNQHPGFVLRKLGRKRFASSRKYRRLPCCSIKR